jgi:5-methylcytosine-specific restriction endonuclease McrA
MDALPEASSGRSKRLLSESLKKIVAAEQKWTCAHCLQLLPWTYEVDHIKALYLGGTNERENLQALCPNCHGALHVAGLLG